MQGLQAVEIPLVALIPALGKAQIIVKVSASVELMPSPSISQSSDSYFHQLNKENITHIRHRRVENLLYFILCLEQKYRCVCNFTPPGPFIFIPSLPLAYMIFKQEESEVNFSNAAQHIISGKASQISLAINLGSVPQRKSLGSFGVTRIPLSRQLASFIN